jgi:hypothetical protein
MPGKNTVYSATVCWKSEWATARPPWGVRQIVDEIGNVEAVRWALIGDPATAIATEVYYERADAYGAADHNLFFHWFVDMVTDEPPCGIQ